MQELNTTSGDDITVSYTYDDNGQVISITDGLSASWYKGYDALGRMSRLGQVSVPTYEFAIVRDGNGNITKTTDFKSTEHWYQYDELNRMTGHGANSSADDELYDWGCCTKLVAYDDNFGTAALVYDDLARLTEHTDSQGNVVEYTYDSMGRVASVTPAQGSDYQTEYTYNKAGGVTLVRIHTGPSTHEDTTYTYDTTSGQLTQRNLPASGGGNQRSTYSYDAAGRLEYDTITRETGSTQNLFRTKYEYAYIVAGSGGGRTLTRTEQNWNSGGGVWENLNKVTYTYNSMEWLRTEQRHDWVTSAWSAVYDVNQVYDKNGNRIEYDKNVQGSTSDYGTAYHLEYTYNSKGFMTAITNADDANYAATVSCDNNNNIEEIVETISGTEDNHLYTYFEYDDLNRLTSYSTKRYVDEGPARPKYWLWTKRSHGYDATGRLLHSNWKQWEDGDPEPGGDSVEHVYDGAKFSQNYDGSSTYGEVWHWAGAANQMAAPLRSRNADANTTAYNFGNNASPQRRTYLTNGTAAEQRNLWAQGRPMSKDSTTSAWSTGLRSQPQNGNMSLVESRVFYEGTVSPADTGHATDVRDVFRIGIFGTDLIYAGSYGRVNSETLGRDLNPNGRGDGRFYAAGALRLSMPAPQLPMSKALSGSGFSSNNSGGFGGGDGGGYREKLTEHCKRRSNCDRVWTCGWVGVVGLVLPEPESCCSNLCTAAEETEDPIGCDIRVCKCIACGCIGHHYACMPYNCDCFNECGCSKYGSCIYSDCNPTNPAACSPGRMLPFEIKDQRWDYGGGCCGGGRQFFGNMQLPPPGGGEWTGKTRLCDNWVRLAIETYLKYADECLSQICTSDIRNCLIAAMKELGRRGNIFFPHRLTGYRSYVRYCANPQSFPLCIRCSGNQRCAFTEGKLIYICCDRVGRCGTLRHTGWCDLIHVLLHEAVHLGGQLLGLSQCGEAFHKIDPANGIRGGEWDNFMECICSGGYYPRS